MLGANEFNVLFGLFLAPATLLDELVDASLDDARHAPIGQAFLLPAALGGWRAGVVCAFAAMRRCGDPGSL
jgi:hypothetical protein